MLRFLERRREETGGQQGVRMKDFRELFPLAFQVEDLSPLSEAINALIAGGKLFAFDIEYAACGYNARKRRVSRADLVTNVDAVPNAMIYLADVDRLPRQIKPKLQRTQRMMARALAAKG